MDLKNLKVDLIGVGGIGGHLITPLLMYLNHEVARDGSRFDSVDVTVIDGDTYEHRNGDRQVFDKTGNKAEVTVDRLRPLFPNLMPSWKGDYIIERNVARFIKEGHVILLAVDNYRTRKLVSEQATKLKNVIVISGGNDGVEPHKGLDGTSGNIQVHIRVGGKDLLLPIANKFHREIMDPNDVNPGDGSGTTSCTTQAPNTPQLVVTNFAVASVMLNAFYAVLEGKCDYDECYLNVLRNNTNPRHRTNKAAAQAPVLSKGGKR